MITRIYKETDLLEKKVIEDIQKTISSGRIVVFPTETVYGIGASAFDTSGIKKIYQTKGRPSDNPLIVHVKNQDELTKYGKDILPYVFDLVKHFWPGPLTLIVKKSDLIPTAITGGLDTVGIRMPMNQTALTLLNQIDVPLCAPSANLSGKPSATSFKHVLDDFDGLVDIIIDGGSSSLGIESTVLDVTTEAPVILRPGMITKSMIEGLLHKEVLMQSHLQNNLDIPKAPGMKYKHYAPKGELVILEGDESKVIDYLNQVVPELEAKKIRVGIIITKELKDFVPCKHQFIIGEKEDSESIAKNLFRVLREADEKQIQKIFSMAFYGGEYGEAIMNRLNKAAGGNIITL